MSVSTEPRSGVASERRDGVATVTIDRPGRKNALDPAAFARLAAELTALDADPDVRVVVITGAGGDFCAGADLSGSDDRPHPLIGMEEVNRAAVALHRLSKPSIAKVDGVAVGAGFNLALGCDLVVASDRARFSEIFSKRGLSVDFGGSWLLVQRVGLHRAKELCLLAEVLPASRAAEMGLVNKIVGVDELDAAVAEWADQLAAGPPVAITLTKRLLDQAVTSSFEDALDREAHAQAVNLMGVDAPEAFAAFRAKRTPTFTGGWAPAPPATP
ncbi:enoyl-CoA hydratase/isomerase family protein [Actinomycetospora sp. TBRC 11914]|uniref:enoyl-CoA hydratase/isomerase family protein n=1 Tax=Actinomycetospora sp. TBRC 11914 TaxID=2729387 RepID=UPI00145CDA16|nr:enoyl-CoA hydratase [Actinomycetospora sp. TBRC 11914]NMO91627.1 enoyl-CoA hydratase [Actinomycetospora sp. TBRC 11914]